MPIGAAITASTAIGAVAARSDRNSAKAATDAQSAQVADNQAYIEQQGQQARSDLFELFPEAAASHRIANQSSLDLFGQLLPAQQGLFKEGNVAAQNQLIQGNQQVQNALMGMPVDNSFQAYSATIPQINIPSLSGQANTAQTVNASNSGNMPSNFLDAFRGTPVAQIGESTTAGLASQYLNSQLQAALGGSAMTTQGQAGLAQYLQGLK